MKKFIIKILICCVLFNSVVYAIPGPSTIPRYNTTNNTAKSVSGIQEQEKPYNVFDNLTQEQVLRDWIYKYFQVAEQYNGMIQSNNILHLYCKPTVNLNNTCDLDFYVQNSFNHQPTVDELWQLAVQKYNLTSHKGLYRVEIYYSKIKVICK